MTRLWTRSEVGAALGAIVIAALAADPAGAAAHRKPDLADAVQGTYSGDVISDSEGSSHPNVALTLTRVSANRVRIDSDYPRLPVITVALSRAMSTIVNRGGDTAFAFDTHSGKLDVSFHNEVSWSGRRN
jgi:hypothetical protein